MNTFCRSTQGIVNQSLGRLKSLRTVLSTALLSSSMLCSAFAQSAPQIISFTPADGANEVPSDTPIVIEFSQPISDTVGPVPSGGGIIGNYEIEPSNVFYEGEISSDRQTMTLTPSGPIPSGTMITWTINPENISFPFFLLTNAAGDAVETFSRSFTTGGVSIPAPELQSVFPDYDMPDVSPSTPIAFDFDSEMDTSVPPQVFSTQPGQFGNIQIEPDSAAESYTAEWDGDSGLFLSNTTPLDPGTVVTWTLNPSGTFLPLTSADGGLLAEVSGSFTVAGESTGNNEDCDPMDDGSGEYGILKSFGHEQISANEVIPLEDEEAFFGAFVESPDAGPNVTAGSITIPDAGTQPLSNSFSIFTFFSFIPDEATLEDVFPPGSYVLRFTQQGQSERVIPMTMPTTFSSIPMITNYAAAQAIDSTQDFTIEWGEFSGQGIEQRIAITISDSMDNIVFTAPNECIPRELSPTATSIEIPAGFLQPGTTYFGALQFSDGFYLSDSAVPDMSGFGSISRYTNFEINTLGEGGGDLIPATFTDFDLVDGTPTFSLSGSSLGAYLIQRSPTVDDPVWTPVGTATLDETGIGTFVDNDSNLSFPAFYQAVGNPLNQ